MHADQKYLTNQQYADSVASDLYPELSDVPLGDVFENANGKIQNVLLSPITSVARIESKRGAVRANHWHRTDWHYALVESGHVLYFERAIGSTEVPDPRSFCAGEMFFTPPNREHAMLFLVDTVIYTFARNERSHDKHEEDVVRVSFVTPEIVAKYL